MDPDARKDEKVRHPPPDQILHGCTDVYVFEQQQEITDSLTTS